MAGIDFEVVPSNNHASPSGALPFLLPPSSPSPRPSAPLTGEKIHKYAREHAVRELPVVASPRIEAYHALLTQRIRPAWVRQPLLTMLYQYTDSHSSMRYTSSPQTRPSSAPSTSLPRSSSAHLSITPSTPPPQQRFSRRHDGRLSPSLGSLMTPPSRYKHYPLC